MKAYTEIMSVKYMISMKGLGQLMKREIRNIWTSWPSFKYTRYFFSSRKSYIHLRMEADSSVERNQL